MFPESLRLCPRCHAQKTPQEFPVNRPDGRRRRTCLACQAAAYRTRYQQDERRRALQIAYSPNGIAQRRDSQALALAPGQLAALVMDTPECRSCGMPNQHAGRGFQRDHIVRLSKGSTPTWDNLALSCAPRHRAKWDSTEEEFFRWLEAARRLWDKRALQTEGLGSIISLMEPRLGSQ